MRPTSCAENAPNTTKLWLFTICQPSFFMLALRPIVIYDNREALMHRFIRLVVCFTFITLLGTACGGTVSPTVVPTRVALNGRPTLLVSSPVEGALVGA